MSATQTLSERPKNLLGLLPIINRWKYQVIGLTFLAAIISAGIAYILPNIYSSTTVFYPTNLRTVDPDRIFEGQKIELTGTTEDIDRIITIGQSQPLAEYIVNKYKLYKDYELENINDDVSKQYALDEFASNLNIIHNERDAIELTFFSKNKLKAAAVANDIVNQIDLMNQQLTFENRKKVLDIFENRYKVISQEFEGTRKNLDDARRKYGIFGLDRESRYLGKNIIETQTDLIRAKGELEMLQRNVSASDSRVIALRAQINGLENAYRALTKTENGNLHNLESYSAGVEIVNELYAQHSNLLERYITAKAAYENAKIALTGKISTVYVVQKAYPAMLKTKPRRSAIVISAIFLTFVISIIFIALYELYKREAHRFSL